MSMIHLVLLVGCTGQDVPVPPGTETHPIDTATTVSDSGKDSGRDTGTRLPGSTLVQHGQIVCADATLRESAGPMTTLDHGEAWTRQLPEGWSKMRHGTGLAVEDFDGDGRWDILVAHRSRPMLFLGSEDDELVLVDGAVSMDADLAELTHWELLGTAAGDLDGDGAPDLVLASREGGVRILRNTGGAFEDVTATSGVPSGQLYVESLPLGDVDGDGDLDLFLGQDSFETSPPDPAWLDGLLLNRGDGTLEDVGTRLLDTWRDGYTKLGMLADLDQDGVLDIYVVHHQSSYRGNKLVLATSEGYVGAEDAGLDISLAGMGLGLGDVNADGLPDLLISGWGEFALMESAGPGIWYRNEKGRELIPDRLNDQEVAWATELADVDNDGDLDVLTGYGPASYAPEDTENPTDQPDGLWLREGEVFVDAAAAWGLDQKRSTRSLVVYDHNGDGWLDVLKGGEDKKALLITARCGDAAWVTVDLDQGVPNPRAIGARVEVTTGDQSWTRWLTAASTGYRTSPPPQLHFGLGDLAQVGRMVVTWPDGAQDTFDSVPTRQRLTVRRGSR